MTLNFTILGCGSSGGVPRPALGWGHCDPSNPKNRRRRTSLLVERRTADGVTRVLVDTSPDLREQLLDADVDWLDGVFYTHEHADHTHGIDDLRSLFIKRRQRVDVYLDESTAAMMRSRFGYCFQSPPGSGYPPIATEHRLTDGVPVTVTGKGGPISVLPFLQEHGDINSLGFRFAGLAYSCDLSGIPASSLEALGALDLWIVDALRYTPHPRLRGAFLELMPDEAAPQQRCSRQWPPLNDVDPWLFSFFRFWPRKTPPRCRPALNQF
jgi:phosphoribosyl 1,2-cyclic phosphate phosphodiesterase